MSNKVKNKITSRITAVLLILIMTAGSFSAVYADESGAEVIKDTAKASSAEVGTAETAEKKSSVKPEAAEKDQEVKGQKNAATAGETAEAAKESAAEDKTAEKESNVKKESTEKDQEAKDQEGAASADEATESAAEESAPEEKASDNAETESNVKQETAETEQEAEAQKEDTSAVEAAKSEAAEPAAEDKSAESTGDQAAAENSQAAEALKEAAPSVEPEPKDSAMVNDEAAVAPQPADNKEESVKDDSDITENKQVVKKPALNEGYGAVYLPKGVTASFTRDGSPASWTGDGSGYGYAIPVGAAVKLSVSTDASKYIFSATPAKDSGTSLSISGDTFTMPEGRWRISVQLFYSVNIDLTSESVPDGSTVTVNGTAVNKGQSSTVLAKAGDTVQFAVSTAASEYDISAVNAKSGEAVSVTGNTFDMPEANVNLSVSFGYNLNLNLTAQDVPDGFYVTINGTKVSKGEKKAIMAEAGSTYRIEDIPSIKGVNYGTDRPSGTTQVKMLLSAGGSKTIVPISDLQSSGYKMPSSNVDASLYVLYGWKTTFTGDLHTCSMQNMSDRDSPWYGHAGDKIRINFDRSSCTGPVEIHVKDASGNTVAKDSVNSDSYTFTMPASVANITIKGEFEKKKYNVTIKNIGHGSVKIDSSEQTEGSIVKVETIPDKGYAINPAGIMIAYKRGTQYYSIKPAPDEEDSSILTFTMPSADVTIGGAFVKPHVVKVTTNKGGKVTVDYRNPYGEYSSRGRDVYLKVTPKKGYVLKAWAARDTDGNKVEIDSEEGYITMPDADVAVAAVFGKKSTGGSSGSSGGSGGYIFSGSESYYTDETLAEDDEETEEEVDEEVTPEELLDLVPLTSAITANTVLAVVSGLNMMLSI